MTIETARLRLVPYAPEHLLALIEEPERFAERFGLPAAEGLRGFLTSDDVSPVFLEILRASPIDDPWTLGFAIVDRETSQVIGNAAFKGPPADGVIEIAYAVVPAFEGRGCATEAVGALLAFAADDGRARVVRAHTLPARNASTRVLEKCGFAHAGEVVDPEDGPVWRWERALARAPEVVA